MVSDVFNLLTSAFAGVLGFFDSIFDGTGMWPVFIGAFTIYAICNFIVLPMLKSSAGKSTKEGGSKSDG